MKNPDREGRELTTLIERALDHAGRAEVARPPAMGASSLTVVGKIVDTHHPHLRSRVFASWLDDGQQATERWVRYERHLRLHRDDQVLLTRPAGWSEWIVVGVLASEATDEAESTPVVDRELVLGPGEAVSIVGHDRQPLMRVQQGERGPVVEFCQAHVELKAARTLRLTGDCVEIEAGQGGVDIRTPADAVVRAHRIRLN